MEAQRPPNLIVVLADDLSYGDISFFGQQHFSTPNIDRLAREGMVFTNGYAAAAWCAPSRTGLLTGCHGGHFQPLERDADGRGACFRPTVAEGLKTAGYATAIMGKWHMAEGGEDTWLFEKTWEEQKAATNWKQMPWHRGFDVCRIGYRCSFEGSHGNTSHPWRIETGDDEHIPLVENQAVQPEHLWEYDPDQYDEQGYFRHPEGGDPEALCYSEDYYRREASQFMEANRDQPFFLYYATPLVHGPLVVKQLDEFEDTEGWSFEHRLWATMVQELDRSVGFLMDEVERLGVQEDTVILFASDNGYSQWGYFRNHGRGPWSDDPIFQNKGPWNRGKFVNTNGGVVVPFMAWGPGRVAAGETQRAVNFYDLMATAADLSASACPGPTDGVSFVPLLEGRPEDQALRATMYWAEWTSARGVDRNDWEPEDPRNCPRSHAVLLDEQFFAIQIREQCYLFDIFKDPGMEQDLAPSRQDLRERATAAFAYMEQEQIVS